MPYQPAKNGQIDGSPLDESNCVPATCVMGVDRATVGTKRPTTAAIRKASGDTSGGLLFTDAARATEAVTGVKGTVRLGISRNDVRALLLGGHALTVGINCAVTRWTAYRTNYYTGFHAVFANSLYEQTATVEDPGTTSAGYLYWPLDLLYRAAESFTGNGGINVIVWPDTEGVTKVAVKTGRIRGTASTEGPDLGPIVLGKAYTAVTTVTGGSWWSARRKAYANGWWRVAVGTGYGFIRGEALA